jgi:NitT/TauT family transport system substrate-binding protein
MKSKWRNKKIMMMTKNLSLKTTIIVAISIIVSTAWSRHETVAAGIPTANQPHLELKIGAVFGVSTISMLKLFQEKPALGKNVSTIYETITSPDQVAARMISGELDMVMVASNLGAKLYNKGVPYKLAGVMVWGNLYVVSRESLQDWHDLKGREIFMHARGLTPDYVFQHLLRENGLDPQKDVKLTYLPGGPQALAMAFIGGKSQISIMPEPMLAKVQQRCRNTHIVIDIQKEWQQTTRSPHPGFPQGALLIKNRIIEDQPEIVELFLQKYTDSIAWLNANPALAGEYAENLAIGMQARAVTAGIPGCNLHYVDSQDAAGELETLFTILYKFNPDAVGGSVPDQGLYYNRQTK